MANEVEQRIGYVFSRPELLTEALTHPSYAAENGGASYQRLEFLGDAVLQIAVSDRLYRRYADVPEGGLTRARAALVCEASLAEAARRFKLGKHIRLSVGEKRYRGREKPSILSDVMEAVIAAVYVDGGMEAAFALAHRALGEAANLNVLTDADAKSRLQELVQAAGYGAPIYEQTGAEGPPHAPIFTERVLVGGETLAEASGHSKRAAQQAAAQLAIERFQTHSDQ